MQGDRECLAHKEHEGQRATFFSQFFPSTFTPLLGIEPTDFHSKYFFLLSHLLCLKIAVQYKPIIKMPLFKKEISLDLEKWLRRLENSLLLQVPAPHGGSNGL